MKKTLLLCAVLMLMLAGFSCGLGESEGDIRRIIPLQTFDSRVKLRSAPSTDGKVFGQYYTGTEINVFSVKNGWVYGAIGEQTGYMMEEFLVPSNENEPFEKTLGYVFLPDPDGCISLWNANGREIARIPKSTVQVLGTIDERTLHIAAIDANGQRVVGFASSEKISWTENFSTLVTNITNRESTVNLRETPSFDAPIRVRLYDGVELRRLFDHHTANDGWTYVHVGEGSSGGSLTGYIKDEFLVSISGGLYPCLPRPATLIPSSAIITGSLHSHIYQNDPLFVLGIGGSKTYPLYYCLAGGWQEDGTYDIFTCYVQEALVQPSGKESISLTGMLKTASSLYQPDESGQMQPLTRDGGTPVLFPAGSHALIHYGTGDDLKIFPDDILFGYFTEDTTWVYVELETTDSTIFGYLPLDTLEYDPRLMLPGNVTNG